MLNNIKHYYLYNEFFIKYKELILTNLSKNTKQLKECLILLKDERTDKLEKIFMFNDLIFFLTETNVVIINENAEVFIKKRVKPF